jgi:hypothetical protein
VTWTPAEALRLTDGGRPEEVGFLVSSGLLAETSVAVSATLAPAGQASDSFRIRASRKA